MKRTCKRMTKCLMSAVLCFALLLPGVAASAQNITIKGSAISLSQVVASVEQQTNYLFIYNENVDLGKKVSVNLTDASVESVLSTVFAGTGIAFSVSGSNITLTPEPAKQTSSNRTVKGTVIDPAGLPVMGASVIIAGTTTGTITDLDGNYTLNIPAGQKDVKLEFSSLGYETAVLDWAGQPKMDVTLAEESLALEGTVVTALGIKRSEKALNYNVQQIGSEKLTKVKDVNFVNSLNGKVAGVTINASSSGVGGETKVVMRGSKSISQSSNALYVIDGIPIFTNGDSGSTGMGSEGVTDPMADINAEDIESISVLTGAAAAALYGSNAANGAVVITTKKGSAGKTQLTVSSNTEAMNPMIFYQFQNRYGNNDGEATSWGSLLSKPNTYNPAKDFFNTGVVGTENVTFSTGNDHNQTFASVGAVNSKGIIPNNTYDKYNFSIRNTSKFLHDKLNIDLGAQYVIQNQRNVTNQGVYSNPVAPAYLYPRGEDWEYAKIFETYDPERKIYTQNWEWQKLGGIEWDNPYWDCYRTLREKYKKRYMLNGSLSYDITDWLKITGRARIDNSYSIYTDKKFGTTNTTLTGGSLYGHFTNKESHDFQTYADVLLAANKRFGADWTVSANVGASISDMQHHSFEIGGALRDGGLPNVFVVGQIRDDAVSREISDWREQTQSVFGSAEVGFKGAYYLTATVRNDWPSQLAGPHSNVSSFFYPSVGGSVVLSQILDLPKQINFLKVRGSWAQVGLPFKRFIANPTYSWDSSSKAWETSKNYPMYNLLPEKTDSWEVGMTFKGFDGFNFDISYYDARTYNQTFNSKLSVSSGYTNLYVQTGAVRNNGIELTTGYEKEWKNFSLSTNLTFSHNHNEIETLMEGYVHPESGAIISLKELDMGGHGSAKFVLRPGGTLGDIYTNADLARDENGNVYVDKDGKISKTATDEYKLLGTVFPTANMGWNNNFELYGVNFGFLISARIGGIVYSATQAYLDNFGVSEATAAARDRGYVQAGDFAIDPHNWYGVISTSEGLPQYYTYDATNVRLAEAHIGYTIPKKVLGNICEMNISLVGRNLWMIYCKAPFDPETMAASGNYYQGIDYFMVPSTRNIGLSLRLKF